MAAHFCATWSVMIAAAVVIGLGGPCFLASSSYYLNSVRTTFLNSNFVRIMLLKMVIFSSQINHYFKIF